jgi:phage baseplate assembly protein W
MTGVSATTGKPLNGMDHLRQSIRDILTTRIGTRVMRRDYGSNVPNVIDSPVNDFFAVDLYVAVAEALAKWEPRFALRETAFVAKGDGVIEFTFKGIYLPDGRAVRLEGVVVK